MNEFDVKKYDLRMFAKDEVVTNNTFESGLNNNDLIIGGPGSGKTGGYIFQALANPSGSMVVSDTKGLLCRIFRKELEEKGYEVQVLDFIHPENSVAYNPLSCVRIKKGGKICDRDIKKIASTLMPVLDSRDPFWEKAATRYISMLISYVFEALPAAERTMVSVVELHRECLQNGALQLIAEFAEDNTDSFTSKKYKELEKSVKAEKMWYSIMEFANEALDPFDYEEFYPIFNDPMGISLKGLGRKKTVLFLNSSDNDPSFHVLCDIFHTQLLQCLIEEADDNENGRLNVPVRIILDDFAASSKIEHFDNIISIIRSRDIYVSVIVQSLSQLTSKYSEPEKTTIINNCDHILCLTCTDIDTAQFLGFHMNRTPHTITCLPLNKAILLTTGQEPRIVDKLTPYKRELISTLESEGSVDEVEKGA